MQGKKLYKCLTMKCLFSFTITKNVHAYKQTKRNAPRSYSTDLTRCHKALCVERFLIKNCRRDARLGYLSVSRMLTIKLDQSPLSYHVYIRIKHRSHARSRFSLFTSLFFLHPFIVVPPREIADNNAQLRRPAVQCKCRLRLYIIR